MNIYLLRQEQRLSPFNERLDSLPFAETSIHQERCRIAQKRGLHLKECEPADDITNLSFPALLITENCFVSEKALADFLRVCAEQDTICQLALAHTPSTEYTRPIASVTIDELENSGAGAVSPKAKGPEAQATQRVRYNCFYLPQKPPAVTFNEVFDICVKESQAIIVPKREIIIPLRLPLLGTKEENTLAYPITSTVACHIDHWVHLLWLNQLAFAIRWNEIVRAHPFWTVSKIIRTCSVKPEKLLPKMNRIGTNCNIHPTAYLEGCIIGNNVTIGARSTVRNCVLGDDVVIDDHANVLSSVLAKRVYVSPKTYVVWSLADEAAVISNYKLQVSVLGKKASTSTWAGLVDAKLKGFVDVMYQGKKHSTERRFLGSCMGHNAYIGAKVLILPGREIPNDAFIAMRPDELIQEVPEKLEPGVPYMRDGGTLVPAISK